ncbi:molybdate ABC transporter permease subunit [Anaerosphaera multitolerans]|uniref:Molybdenum transport system permease n=1 Tax=Anaerosphaera multitolerans TaxID=2487351 RepID=A0A437S540_9FIRM|nr:molybdate ABC transporter permease subunit [Anaerosphaera multitolerans]RVU54131.1 molybdate ABC transporter permease subunit [Anaerosphaera multitolerans]
MDSSPILLSIKTAFIATVITFFLGIYSARLVKSTSKFRGILDGLFTLPMVLPPTVVGFFLLILLGVNGPFKEVFKFLNIQIVFSYSATVIAAIVVSFPLMYRTALGAFEQVNESYIYAAQTLGLKNSTIFWKIVFPLSRPGLISGVVLSFTRALGEFGATIMIAGNIEGRTQTISTAIYSAVQAGNRPLAFRWSLIVVFISFTTIITVNLVSKRKYHVD